VVVYIGDTTNIALAPAIDAGTLLGEFGVLTKINGITRRKAINTVSRKYGMSPNDVYAIIEKAKQSG